MKTFRYKTACKQVLGDLHTPVSIYLKVRDIYPQSALLESSDFHAGENSLSYIALCPLASFGVNGDVCTMSFPDRTVFREPVGESLSVTDALNAFLKKFRIEGEQAERCGLFGYTAFDAVKYFEKIPVIESHDAQNDAPDIMYILYKYLLVFNHFKNELTLIELLGRRKYASARNRKRDRQPQFRFLRLLVARGRIQHDHRRAIPGIRSQGSRPLPPRRRFPDRTVAAIRTAVCRGRLQSLPRCAASTRRPTFLFQFRRVSHFRIVAGNPLQSRTAAPVSIRSPVRPGAPATR